MQANAAKEVQVVIPEKMVDASSKVTSSTTECKVLDADISGSYSGGCKDGLANGEGVAKGKDEYRGVFVNGKPHGKGTYTSRNGDKYVGDFVDGIQYGKGAQTSNDGYKYEGDWVNGKYYGKGIVTSNKGIKYEGDWVDNEPRGKMTKITRNGDKFVGEFVDGVWVNAQSKPQFNTQSKSQFEVITASEPRKVGFRTSKEVCDIIDQDPTWNKIIQWRKAFNDLNDKYKKNIGRDSSDIQNGFYIQREFGYINQKIWNDVFDKCSIGICDTYKPQVRPTSQLLVTCGEELYKNGKLFYRGKKEISEAIKAVEPCAKDENQCNGIRSLDEDFYYPFAFHLNNGAEKASELAGKREIFASFEKSLKKQEEKYKEDLVRLEESSKRDKERKKEGEIQSAQKAERISKIKNGNLAAAKTIREVAEALIPGVEVVDFWGGYLYSRDGIAVYRTPTKKLYAFGGQLISYKGKQATTFNIDPVTGIKYAFILKFSDKTLWFKDRIDIGTNLYFVGRYVDNDTVSVKQGSNEFDVTARVYEVLSASSK